MSTLPDDLKILMLEDDPADAELATQALLKSGMAFTSRRVDTRQAFIAALEEFNADIILADYHLPAFDGLAALAIARDRVPDVPFVFVSGAMGEELAIETLHGGAADYVLKSHLSKLAPAVSRALQEAAERRLRRRAEAKLAASEERFRKIAESAQDGLIIVDEDEIITYWNPAAETMFGYTPGEALGQSMHGLLTPVRYRDAYRQGWEQFRETGQGRLIGQTLVLSAVRKGGEEFPIEVSISSVAIEGRWFAIGILRDISERYRAEAVRRELAAIVESTEDAIIGKTLDGCITTWNNGAAKIYGYSADEIVGKSVKILAPPGREQEVIDLLAVVEGGKSVVHYETTRRRKDGRQIEVSLSLSPIRDADGVIRGISTIARDITERKAAERQIEHLAYYDLLTQLPNRRLLLDRLQQALAGSARSRQGGALLFIDLDNFKILNETCGHDVGDRLLVEVAQRLVASVRDGDTVARLGGDEFVVMLEDLGECAQEAAAQAKDVGESILSSLNRPYTIAGRVQHSTPSIGITLFTDRDDSVDELLKQADIAMYQAKSAGRNTLRFFDPEMQAALASRAVLEAELRLGIRDGQFILHYQPQVDSACGIIGAEALLRWVHPERGMVSPTQFIPLAEETGLILPIGQWVLETACAQLKTWAGDARTRDLRLAVNVSARQFRQDGFVDQVTRALANAEAPATRLKLELTESLVLDDVEDTIKKMQALQQLGVGFSMDDFGTGYSSLSYLTRLPLDQLKIDQSFVRNLPDNPNDAAVAQAIITLARSLELAVIAEGVETEAQRAFLDQHGCPTYQGYLFSRPVLLAQFEQLLAGHRLLSAMPD